MRLPMHALDHNPDASPPAGMLRAPEAVVGVGASAGGLEALEEFFAAADPALPLAYVVVQHLAPDFESRMESILARSTSLEVRRAVEGAVLLSGTIHLIPPANNLELLDGRLHLVRPAGSDRPNHAIDQFLTALAAAHGPRAVAVILSGTGSDGTRGIQAIKSRGGRVLVQRPESARFDGMPRSAIASSAVDLVAAPAELAAALGSGWRAPTTGRMARLDPEGLSVDAQSAGIAPQDVGQPGGGVPSGNPPADEDFAEVRRRTLAAAARSFANRPDPQAPLRAWLHADDQPEHVWAAAMAIDEARSQFGGATELRLFVTADDEATLSRVSNGRVGPHAMAGIPTDRIERSFRQVGEDWTVRHHILDRVVFAVHDMVDAAPFPRCSLLMLRGLLSRLKQRHRRRLPWSIGYALETGGALLLGSTETKRLSANPMYSADPDLPGVLWRTAHRQIHEPEFQARSSDHDRRAPPTTSARTQADRGTGDEHHVVLALQATLEQLRAERDRALCALDEQRATNDELHSVNAELFREHGELAARLDHAGDERDALRALLGAWPSLPRDRFTQPPSGAPVVPWVAVVDRQGGPLSEAQDPPIPLNALPADLVVDLVRAADEAGNPACSTCSAAGPGSTWELVVVPFRRERSRSTGFAVGAWPCSVPSALPTDPEC